MKRSTATMQRRVDNQRKRNDRVVTACSLIEKEGREEEEEEEYP